MSLASGCTIEVAARECGAAVRTVKLWLADVPGFRRRVEGLRSEMTSQALGRLIDNMASASDSLGYLSRKGKSEMVRLSAARAVIELGCKLRETVELAERVAKLEAAQPQPAPKPRIA
ncbi:MAG TPA: hypothetical protein VHE33_07405 [Acidobacteriaceae bacterium]|nr:hypothetical protein [Acidobacteriaceae bacterium]